MISGQPLSNKVDEFMLIRVSDYVLIKAGFCIFPHSYPDAENENGR
jgi:hypothetical protein